MAFDQAWKNSEENDINVTATPMTAAAVWHQPTDFQSENNGGGFFLTERENWRSTVGGQEGPAAGAGAAVFAVNDADALVAAGGFQLFDAPNYGEQLFLTADTGVYGKHLEAAEPVRTKLDLPVVGSALASMGRCRHCIS